MASTKIAPSFLTADLARLADEVRAVDEAGADYLHLDVMDGHFVPPITFGALVVEAIRNVTKLPLDVHLMIERPERHIDAFAQAGGDILNVHIEACQGPASVLAQVRALGCRAGICLNPETSISSIEDIITEVDQVIVMGVNPGWGGQPLIDGTLPKISSLRALLDRRQVSVDVELDGGVKPDNILACAQAGANVLVAGSAVFNDRGSAQQNLEKLRALLSSF